MKGTHVSIAQVILCGFILPQRGINASDFYSKNSQILFFPSFPTSLTSSVALVFSIYQDLHRTNGIYKTDTNICKVGERSQ